MAERTHGSWDMNHFNCHVGANCAEPNDPSHDDSTLRRLWLCQAEVTLPRRPHLAPPPFLIVLANGAKPSERSLGMNLSRIGAQIRVSGVPQGERPSRQIGITGLYWLHEDRDFSSQ